MRFTRAARRCSPGGSCEPLTLARRLRGMGAGDRPGHAAELLPLPPPARRTLTCDNGGEFAHHEHVTLWTEIAAYFCDPGCPGQRGSIENTHGRMRRRLPRRTNLAEVTMPTSPGWFAASTPPRANASTGARLSRHSPAGSRTSFAATSLSHLEREFRKRLIEIGSEALQRSANANA